MRLQISCALLALALAPFAGCSGGGTPPTFAPEPAPATQALPTALPPDTALFGAWDIAIDPATLNFEVAPVREAAAFGDNYWINATGYLDGVPCGDCFALRSLSHDVDGHIVVTAAIRHPFQPGNTGLPVSAINRLDLHVFDAQLLLAGDADTRGFVFEGVTESLSTKMTLDADGYSDLLSSAVALPGGTATVFPYVTIAEDPTAGNYAASNPGGFADLAAPTGHNVFAMGSEHLTSFTLGAEEGDSFRFRAYFLANYGVSAASRAERLTPRYALPEYNAKAAWKVSVDIPSATNDLTQGDPGSTAAVEVRVWDWQPSAPVDATLGSLDAIRASSDVASVRVTAPGIMTTDLDLGAPVSGTGPLDDPLVYQGTIINNALATMGDYFVAVQVEDSRLPGLNSGGQTDGLSNQTGLQLDPVAITAFRTYQIAPVSVGGRTLLSIAITPNTRQIIDQGAGNAIAFSATGTYDLPPLTEDITSSVTWNSSASDVGVFGGDNTLEGVGMGVTSVTATLDSITSPATQVIVKPLLFQTLPLSGTVGVDANQNTGDVYIGMGATLQRYNDLGVFQGALNVPFSPNTVSVDETTGNIWGCRSAATPSLNMFQVTSAGALVNQISVDSQFGPNAMVIANNGQLWAPEWVGTHNDLQRFNPTTGVQIDGFNCPNASVLYGAAEMGNYFAVANPGSRYSNQALIVVDWQAETQVAVGGNLPTNYGQNSFIAVDRDNFIHMEHQGDFGAGQPGLIKVYEFNPGAGSVTLLYQYSSSTGAYTGSAGIGVSRPNNVVVHLRIQNTPFTWDVRWLD